jgi:hypothetical protein
MLEELDGFQALNPNWMPSQEVRRCDDESGVRTCDP